MNDLAVRSVSSNSNWYKVALAAENASDNDKMIVEAVSKRQMIIPILLGLISGGLVPYEASLIRNWLQHNNVQESAITQPVGKQYLEELTEADVLALQTLPEPFEEVAPEATPEDNSGVDSKQMAEMHNIIARTIWAEGKSESELGKRAIATVLFNASGGNLQSMISDIKKPKRYSCWNAMEPADWENFQKKNRWGRAFDDSEKIATELVTGTFSPIAELSQGETHYYNPKKCKMSVPPYWAYKDGKWRQKEDPAMLIPYVEIENHRFIKTK